MIIVSALCTVIVKSSQLQTPHLCDLLDRLCFFLVEKVGLPHIKCVKIESIFGLKGLISFCNFNNNILIGFFVLISSIITLVLKNK